ncbi:ubiquinol-cytochrome-c reductase complex assembly factor 1 [Heracleum sosnowskyi]|uniref:Ubiquinol-cytochrome-c reductase complex assembly factor 1 n=1 Tax=Heracleum sosnowskyi TaxID=360622 RepID=A0AAD8N2S5_9APIA|nr:ubiquinol-cytochrome-c reductase complex assembly factor 1 [Heracleum sosnowskyi]
MLPRWSRAISQISKLAASRGDVEKLRCRGFNVSTCRGFAKVADVVPDFGTDDSSAVRPQVNLNKMFWAKPCSLALPVDSPIRFEERKYTGIKHIMMKLMLAYSKESRSIERANVIYRRVVAHVDPPAIYDVFNLEKTFRTNFSLLVLHMWLILHRLKEEGDEGADLGQNLYEIYNHDVELRVYNAGVNLLLARWMKELEKIFYGSVAAYEAALVPEAKQDELQNALWRNVFAEEGLSIEDALQEVQAMSRYVRREIACMSMTEKEAILSGNFLFSPLENVVPLSR